MGAPWRKSEGRCKRGPEYSGDRRVLKADSEHNARLLDDQRKPSQETTTSNKATHPPADDSAFRVEFPSHSSSNDQDALHLLPK
ncbi:hypothetical protein [Azospirillum griseum]|uniref:Uncharacterized protein n=1 Tax=Azospirillum griseum TaxID=2496639 RepID=A0A431VG36_9PROT|nr:hypothetical protein [Azospirillum griseum]RTR18923.1 hypothetical protein EJ903_14910 [Azospirillum griseum]